MDSISVCGGCAKFPGCSVTPREHIDCFLCGDYTEKGVKMGECKDCQYWELGRCWFLEAATSGGFGCCYYYKTPAPPTKQHIRKVIDGLMDDLDKALEELRDARPRN